MTELRKFLSVCFAIAGVTGGIWTLTAVFVSPIVLLPIASGLCFCVSYFLTDYWK